MKQKKNIYIKDESYRFSSKKKKNLAILKDEQSEFQTKCKLMQSINPKKCNKNKYKGKYQLTEIWSFLVLWF